MYSGEYTLYQFVLRDDNNRQNQITFLSNGTTDERTWDAEGNTWNYFRSIADVEVTDLIINVVPASPTPDTQTDFRNPVVEALGLDQTTVKAGDHFFFPTTSVILPIKEILMENFYSAIRILSS